jgi:PD-(D/E)XK nuclease superfamily protein
MTDHAELSRKQRGDLAELRVACDIVRRGGRVAIPFGEDADFDLIAYKKRSLARIQVKHGRSRNGVLVVRCRSHSLTNGKVRHEKRYTAKTIDWIAIWDCTTDRCFYIPATDLGSGRSLLHLRLAPARNGQVMGIRNAADYADLELT